MEIKKDKHNNYTIHTIKTNRYKTTQIELNLRKNITEKTFAPFTFLTGILDESSKKYSTRRKVAIKSEEIYKADFLSRANRFGKSLSLTFNIEFINPEFIDDSNYLNNVIDFFFEMILNPNVKDGLFDKTSFDIVQNEMITALESIKEDPYQKALEGAINTLDSKSVSAMGLFGTKEDILSITRENLYEVYLNLLKESVIDFFVIGNTNMDNITKLIKDKFKITNNVNKKIDAYVDNKTRKKVIVKEDTSNFEQTQLIVLYNLDKLTKDERNIDMLLFNFIFGSGGLTSKLYKYVREEKGYCYHIGSTCYRFDNLLCIDSSLSTDDIDDVISLIDKAFNEMAKGNFSQNDINDAKKSIISGIKIGRNRHPMILHNYQEQVFWGNDTFDDIINKIQKVTKEDIMNVTKKIKKNTVYILRKATHEKD